MPSVRQFALHRLAARALPRPFFVSPRLRRMALWKRLLLTLTFLPILLAGGASGGYYLTLHQVSAALRLTGLPITPPPDARRRILVLAPHCDDETVALGGLIADARGAGAEVTVAFLTNGDAFRLAAGRALGDVRLTPDDYVRFAEERQQEAIAALGELGVPADHVIFLSYPDRGLLPLWEGHWDASAPFRSGYTGYDFSPYPRAYTPRAPYCGAALLADLLRLLRATRPTDIFVTHPADDHPDHAAAAAFAQSALLGEQDRGAGWAKTARLRYYLVHRGDWPLPQGLRPDKPLLPPAGMLGLDTGWEVYSLSPHARAAKARALARYASQTAVIGRFLSSFLRENELLCSLPEQNPAATPPAAFDAVGDDVVRYAEPSADLSGLSVRQTQGALRVRVTTRGPVSRRVRYRLRLRLEYPGDDPAAATATRFVSLDLPVRRRGAQRLAEGDGIVPAVITARENAVEAALPLAALARRGTPPRRVWVAAQTQWASMSVDQTGFRLFRLQP